MEYRLGPAEEFPHVRASADAVTVRGVQSVEPSELGRREYEPHQRHLRPGDEQGRQPRPAIGAEVYLLADGAAMWLPITYFFGLYAIASISTFIGGDTNFASTVVRAGLAAPKNSA